MWLVGFSSKSHTMCNNLTKRSEKVLNRQSNSYRSTFIGQHFLVFCVREAPVTCENVAAKAVTLCDIVLTGTHIPAQCSRTLHQVPKSLSQALFFFQWHKDAERRPCCALSCWRWSDPLWACETCLHLWSVVIFGNASMPTLCT